MNSMSAVSETSSSSSCNQHQNVKEEIDADSMELTIKVEGEGEEVVPVKLEIKTEDEEKPSVCQCEECGSGGRGRVDRCTRACSSSQAIKKEEWEDEDEQSGEMAVKEEVDEGSSRGRVVKAEDDANCAPVRMKREGIEAETGGKAGCRKKAKRTEILVKEEVKEEENEINMAGPSTQRCGSSLVDSEIIKFEDDEDMTCPCEDCNTIKTEEGGEEVKEEVERANEVMPGHSVEEEVAAEGVGSSDEETVVEDGSEAEEDWLASSGSSLGSSSEEEEETDDVPNELMQEPIETVSGTAPLEVSPVAGADAEQARTAKGRKLHRCPQCQKMVTRLAHHLLTHTGQRPHICNQCGKSFNKKANLNAHLKIHTRENAFFCQQCGKCFKQKSNLTVHLNRHSGEKAYQCNQCPSAFVTTTELINHRRQKHTGQRPYVCHIANCHKAFANQSNLITHLKYHTGDKRHHCENCEMRFVTRKELTRHRRQHTGERPYACPTANCDKAFASQSNLNTHLRHHNGDKRHQCEDCEMRFVTRGELTRHRHRKHSTERPYRCSHSGCNYASAAKYDLKQHLKKKHRQSI